MATEVCMPANVNSTRFCPVLGRWGRLRAPRMLRKFLLTVLRSPLRTLPAQTLTPRIHHHEASRPHWVPNTLAPDADKHKAVPVDLECWGDH